MTVSTASLDREYYLSVGDASVNPGLNFLTAKYKNIGFLLNANQTFVVTKEFVRNAPGIAYHIYRNPDYWPYLLMFNGIVDPVEDLTVGKILQVPDKQDIDAMLNSSDVSDLSALTI